VWAAADSPIGIEDCACAPEGDLTCADVAAEDYSDSATGVEGAAFCYKITVTNCGTEEGLVNVQVDDPDIAEVAGAFLVELPADEVLPVGESVTLFFKKSFDTAGTYPNTVTANGVGATSGVAAEPAQDSAEVIVVPISVECDIELVGEVLPPVGCDATLTTSGPVQFTLTINNTGDADLNVTVTGLPTLNDCDVEITDPIFIAAGDSFVTTCTTDVTCPEGADFNVTVVGTAVASETVPCVFDSEGNAVSTEESTCDACVNCQEEGLFCRTTGGGDLLPDTTDELTDPCIDVETTLSPGASALGQLLTKVTHGGQMGAPFADESCPTTVGELGNPCIKGQWQHVRHYQGTGNPRDVVSAFHAGGPNKGVFDTLHCECLPCCEPSEEAELPPGWENKDICNPFDHKVCGPLPRPAPANALIWTGVGQMNQASDTGKKPAKYVVVRVYIEDRSEPGGHHPKGAVLPSDIYSFQAWKTGVDVSKKPDYTTVATTLRLAVAQDACDFLKGLKAGTIPIGSLPSPTIAGVDDTLLIVNDQGPLYVGNRQIHPTTSATCP
jgi:hypothetical protein